jgi:thioredoxin reductase (NADPH)
VAIIGAGIAGMYAVYSCGMGGLDSILVEATETPGGQCMALYAEKALYGVPGQYGERAGNFAEKMSNECLQYARRTYLGCFVDEIERTEETDEFLIRFKDQATGHIHVVSAKHLIIATGVGRMTPCVPSAMSGLEHIDPRSDFVQYYRMQRDFYTGKVVVIVGGGDSAADCAMMAADAARSVVLMHKKPKLVCEAAKIAQIERLQQSSKLSIALNYQIVEIREADSKRLIVARNAEEMDITIEVDHVVFCCGFVVNNGMLAMFRNLGLEIEDNLIKIDINTMATSVKNCYAVGDVVTYANKKKSIVPCLFEADRAVRIIRNARIRSFQ